MNLFRKLILSFLSLIAALIAYMLVQPIVCSSAPRPGEEWILVNRIKAVYGKETLGRVIATQDGILRNIFTLKRGSQMILSGLDSSDLWDSSAGIIRRINGCVHGLSDDESAYVAFVPWPESTMEVRRLESDDLVLKWAHPARYGVNSVLFSPDGRYLAVRFSSTHPVPDDRWGIKADVMKAVDCLALFDLDLASRVEAFGVLYGGAMGEFTNDSRYYLRRVLRVGAQVFDLERGEWVGPGS